jgi:hypothetical protein
MPSEDSLTGYIAEFAACTSFEAIPKEVMELGKKSILDVLGPALTGSTIDLAKNLERLPDIRALTACLASGRSILGKA